VSRTTGQPHDVQEDRIKSTPSVRSQLSIALVCVTAIIGAVNVSRPFYVGRAPIAKQLVAHSYADSAELRAPWLRSSAELALQTPQFLLDRERFAMDLLRTGHVNQTRARSLADVAVREAYTRRVPPALVLGVMLTENDALNSSARSSVGAVGLMQVYPKHWRGALGPKFGTNLHTDSTNLKYGIFILGWVAGKAALIVNDKDEAWRRALLRYNGCVHGTNTKGCSGYPESVRHQVESAAKSTCPGADFDRCVVQPMSLARGDLSHTDSAGGQVRISDR
jgi:soluble lytic murein transglycosylase-like protein